MANVLAAYHTLLLTCHMNGLSAMEYLKKFFYKIVKGRKDYEILLPMAIGIRTNKYQYPRSFFYFFNGEPLKSNFPHTTRQNWTLTIM